MRRDFLKLGLLAPLFLSLFGLPKARAQETNFDALHFPSASVLVNFSDPAYDDLFIQMLQEAGVNTVTLFTSPTEYNALSNRYTNLATLIRARNLKVRFVIQDEVKAVTNLTSLPPTYPNPPSLTHYIETESAVARAITTDIKPDYFSVVAEPTINEGRIGKKFTVRQWRKIISALNQEVKIYSPNTKTWVDILPKKLKERNILTKAITTGIDGVGFDLYDRTDILSTVQTYANKVKGAGKKCGITETWWNDIYANPNLDSPSNAQLEADWLGSTYTFAKNNGITDEFVPFFTNKFVNLQKLPLPLSVANINNFLSAMETSLDNNERTIIHSAYRDLIASQTP